MLELITYKPAFSEPSGSPFCVKAMCLLRMSGLDWTPDFDADPRKAPISKLPVLRDGTRRIADSNALKSTWLKITALGSARDWAANNAQRAMV